MDAQPLALPRVGADLVGLVVCHRDPERHGLLYALVWRVLHGERDLLELACDPLVHRFAMMAKTIRRDLHKFMPSSAPAPLQLKPACISSRCSSPIISGSRLRVFFVNRFRSMRWSILTPVGSLYWDGAALAVGRPAEWRDAAGADSLEESGYYESTFNPARVYPAMMPA